MTNAPVLSIVTLHLVPLADFNIIPLDISVISISFEEDAPVFVTDCKEGVAVIIVLGLVQLARPSVPDVSI